MRHPEKGDAKRAADAMDARSEIVIGRTSDVVDVGDLAINLTSGETSGTGLDAYRKVYGDLFDLGEMMATSTPLIQNFMLSLLTSEDPMGVMTSLFLQGAGMGVMMERQRWTERGE